MKIWYQDNSHQKDWTLIGCAWLINQSEFSTNSSTTITETYSPSSSKFTNVVEHILISQIKRIWFLIGNKYWHEKYSRRIWLWKCHEIEFFHFFKPTFEMLNYRQNAAWHHKFSLVARNLSKLTPRKFLSECLEDKIQIPFNPV